MNKYFVYLVCVVFVCSCTQILLKSSAKEEQQSFVRMFANWKVMLSYGILFASTFINSSILYKHLPIASINLAETFGYIFVPLLSFVIFKEKMNKRQLLGLTLILLGAFIFIS